MSNNEINASKNLLVVTFNSLDEIILPFTQARS